MAARIIIIIVIIVIIARLAGVARTVKLLVSYKGAQVVEADVARPTVTRTAFIGVEALLRWRGVLAFLLHLASHRRWRRRRRRGWLRTLPNLGLTVHLHLAGTFFRSCCSNWFWSRENCFVVEYACYVIFLLKH